MEIPSVQLCYVFCGSAMCVKDAQVVKISLWPPTMAPQSSGVDECENPPKFDSL